MDTGNASQTVTLAAKTILRGQVNDLKPGTTYEFGVVNGATGETVESGVFATERTVPQSESGHIVDGQFTSGNGKVEWADVKPTSGRFGYLYTDFDGEMLHILNDWHLCNEQVEKWDYNLFEVITCGDRYPIQKLRWEIRVHGDGHLEVSLNGEPVELLGRGASGHSASPLIPDCAHSIYELSLPVAEAHDLADHEEPAENWTFIMTWCDPAGPSLSASQAGSVLVREPVQTHGKLFRDGGMTVTADWSTRPPRNGGPAVAVRSYGAKAEIRVKQESQAPANLVWQIRECPLPAATVVNTPAEQFAVEASELESYLAREEEVPSVMGARPHHQNRQTLTALEVEAMTVLREPVLVRCT